MLLCYLLCCVEMLNQSCRLECHTFMYCIKNFFLNHNHCVYFVYHILYLSMLAAKTKAFEMVGSHVRLWDPEGCLKGMRPNMGRVWIQIAVQAEGADSQVVVQTWCVHDEWGSFTQSRPVAKPQKWLLQVISVFYYE